MKFIPGVLLLGGMLSLFGQNILENPSFEVTRENDPTVPEGWVVLKKGSFEKTHKMEDKLVFSGKKAVRIDNLQEATAPANLMWLQYIKEKLSQYQAGTELEFSVMAQAVDKMAQVQIYLESMAARKCYIKAEKLFPGKWTKVSVRFQKENVDYGSPYICLKLIGNGSVVFDGAYLGPVGKNPYTVNASPDLVYNGNAEKLDEKGQPFGWYVINRGKNGTASVTSATASEGKHAFQLSCAEKPQGLLMWSHRLTEDCFTNLKPGSDMVLSLKANTIGNPATEFQFYIEFRKGTKFIGTFMATHQTIYEGWQEKRLRFKLPKEVPTSANIYVQLQGAGTLNFDEVSLKQASQVPRRPLQLVSGNYCRIVSPMPVSNTFFPPAAPKEMKLECFLPGTELKAELLEIDGKKIQEWKFGGLTANKTNTVSLKMPENLAKGAYELRFTSGKMTDYEWFRLMDRPAVGCYFEESGFLMLDGKKFFPIAIITPASELDALRVYSESGINTICADVLTSGQMAKYSFSILQQFGLACLSWNNWGIRTVPAPELRKNFQERARMLAKYRGFIGFYTDEAMWCGHELSDIRQDYKFQFKYLSDYISFLNHAPRITADPREKPKQSFPLARAFSRASDVTGLDIYPVPEGPGHNNLDNTTISCVGEYTDLCRKLTWDRKPVWMILQAFGWSESGGGKLNAASPRPTEKQLRFMAWNAITHGATGILWFGEGCKDPYSEWWRGFARVNLELQAVSRLMLAAPVEKMTGLPDGVAGIKGKGFQVIVNEHSKKTVEISGKKLGPQEVLILTDVPLNIPMPERFTPKEISMKNNYGIHRKTILLDAEWTAHPQYLRGGARTVYALQQFTLKNKPEKAILRVSVDDSAEIYLNGNRIGKISGFRSVHQFNVARYLKAGSNELHFQILNATGPTGLVFELKCPEQRVASGKQTRFSFDGKSNWEAAACLGKPPVAPWGKPSMLQEY